MIHYFDASRLTAVDSICFHLNILLKKYVLPGQPVIVMCIGSDRSTGDSLGPLVGYKLSKFTFENVHVYGCLHESVTADSRKHVRLKMYMFTAVCSHRFMQLTFLPPLIKFVGNTRALLSSP